MVAAVAVGLMAWAAVGLADASGGCDFSQANNGTASCLGPLSGSTFAGGDGNLLATPPAFGSTDWSNVSGLNPGFDLPSGTGDNSFGQGTKEDNPAATVVTGSIPNNKSDLTRFYEASEIGSNNHNFLYLAWERANTLGTANIDFEVNQKATTGFTGSTTGPVTLNRTAGDLLVTFDFTNGGGTPTIGVQRWLTSATTPTGIPGFTANVCSSSNNFPCWGDQLTLDGTDSIAAVNNLNNTDSVTDPLFPTQPNYINPVPPLQFGETAIDLTKANVFPAGTCEAFGSAFVKSRASASFTAEVKDFIAPEPVNISNCGKITIHKVTENGDATFGYTTSPTGSLSPATFNLSNGGTQVLTSSGQTPPNVLPGSYSVTEGTPPSGWSLKSLVCTTTGTGTSATTSNATASITIAPSGSADCTYTNHINASPSIATTLSETTGSVGDVVHDSATLTGATANAGGSVTYTVYSDNACTQNAQDAGTKTVNNGIVPDSNAITFNSAGTFYWQAIYTGDANNKPATSDCTKEQLVIAPNAPTIATTLSETTGSVGDVVHDSATLTGATANAGGSVTYTVYTDNACTQNAQDAGTKTVNNGIVPDSNPITFNSAGTFYWQAIYTGDANNLAAVSTCASEQLVISKLPSTISTTQVWTPQDTATIDHAGGTVTFTLYKNDQTCSNAGAVVYGPDMESVSTTLPFEANTNNNTFFVLAVGSGGDTYYWKAAYTSGDTAHKDVTSCTEATGFSSLTNGGSVTSP
jgi:hypothetical protein